MAVGSGGGGGSRAAGIKAGRAFVEVSADDSSLRTVLGNVRKTVLGFGKSLAAGGGVLAGIGGSVLAPIVASFREVLSHFDQFSKAADRTGATTEALSALAYAAEQSDASLADVSNGAKFLQRTLSEAGAGSKTAIDALAKMGLTADQLKGKSLEEQFALIADGLAAIEDPADRTNAALEVLGRGGLALIPLLGKGAGPLRDLLKEAADVGAVVSGVDADAATRAGDAIQKSWTAVKNTFRAVGAALLPQVETIERWSTVLVSAIKYVRDFINENRALVVGVTAGAAALVALGGAIVGVGSALAITAFALGGFATAASAVGAVLAVVFSPVGLGIAALAVAAVALAAVAAELGALESIAETFGPLWASLTETFSTTWQGIKDAMAGGDLKLAFQVGVAGLKVVWSEFMVHLQATWNSFKDIFVDGWHSVVTEIKVILNDVLKFFQDSIRSVIEALPERLRRHAGLALGPLAGIAAGIPVRDEGAIRSDAAAAQRERDRARGGALDAAVQALIDARAELAGLAQAAAGAKFGLIAGRLAGFGMAALLGQDKRQAALEGVFGATRGQFGGAGLAQALGVGPGSIQEKQLTEAKKANEHLEAIEGKVGGLAVE